VAIAGGIGGMTVRIGVTVLLEDALPAFIDGLAVVEVLQIQLVLQPAI
jgi:hypothetical protein